MDKVGKMDCRVNGEVMLRVREPLQPDFCKCPVNNGHQVAAFNRNRVAGLRRNEWPESAEQAEKAQKQKLLIKPTTSKEEIFDSLREAGMKKIERYRGCLLGLATGDALGTKLEFQPSGTFEPINDMVVKWWW